MPPIVLFGIQFTFALAAYALIAWWYLAPRLSRLPREVALVPLVWIHAFRIVGGAILAPGAVDVAVPMVSDHDRIRRHGNGCIGSAGIVCITSPPACCHRLSLAFPHGRAA